MATNCSPRAQEPKLWTNLHLYQAGEFHDVVTCVFVGRSTPGSVRLSAARGSSVRPHTRGRAH